MAWIESHQSLREHPKTKRLCRLLKLNRREAVGLVHFLWWWAYDYAPEGDLSRFSDDDIADAIDWDGDSGEMVAALIASGFIDAERTLHDWWDYAQKWIERRRANAARMRAARSGHVDDTPDGRAVHVQDTCETRVERPDQPDQPDQTTTEQTEIQRVDESESMGASAPVRLPWEPDDTPLAELPVEQRLFAYFKARIFPTARTYKREKIRARLKTFSEDELRRGIDNFAADWWSMDKNSKRGADWFFANDARSEQYLHMTPRTREQAQKNSSRPTPIRPSVMTVQPRELTDEEKHEEAEVQRLMAEGLSRSDALDIVIGVDGKGPQRATS